MAWLPALIGWNCYTGETHSVIVTITILAILAILSLRR
jgi:hypothetical protein